MKVKYNILLGIIVTKSTNQNGALIIVKDILWKKCVIAKCVPIHADLFYYACGWIYV